MNRLCKNHERICNLVRYIQSILMEANLVRDNDEEKTLLSLANTCSVLSYINRYVSSTTTYV